MSHDHLGALPQGYMLNEYRLEGILGHGGFGITYLARDVNLDKPVAIKEYMPTEFAIRQGETEVQPKSTADEESYAWGLSRFLQEAQILARFKHPSIIAVHRFFETNGTAYMVMEYEEGESLSELLQRQGTLDERALCAILFPLLDGLREVHRAGVLHRDIKPGNIYIRANGTPVLLDFGAARQAVGRRSKSLTAIVTPGYAPFEQYSTESEQGPWTDIYALAAVCYRVLVGERPSDATDRIRNDRTVPIGNAMRGKVDATLLAAIDRGLSVDERERPQSVEAWRAQLEGSRELVTEPTAPIATPPGGGIGAGPVARATGGGASRRAVWIAVVAVVGLVIVGGGVYGYQKYVEMVDTETRLERERQVAEEERRSQAVAVEQQQAEERRRAEDTRQRAEAEARRQAEARRIAAERDRQRRIVASRDRKRRIVAEARRRQDIARRRAGDAVSGGARVVGGDGLSGGARVGGGSGPVQQAYSGNKIRRGWCRRGSQRLVRRSVSPRGQYKASDFSRRDCRNLEYFVRDIRVSGSQLSWSVGFRKSDGLSRALLRCTCTRK